MGTQLGTTAGMSPLTTPTGQFIANVPSLATQVANYIASLKGGAPTPGTLPNLPDLSKTPYGLSSSAATQQGLHALSVGFNSALSADLSTLTGMSGVHIHTLDVFGLFQNIQANPAQFKLSNVTSEGILTGNPSAPGYLFWDDVHPTTAGHQLLANQAAAALAAPEPASLTLLASGFLGLLSYGWRRRRAA
jgi:phospholipase/lecithinase/hemolysin